MLAAGSSVIDFDVAIGPVCKGLYGRWAIENGTSNLDFPHGGPAHTCERGAFNWIVYSLIVNRPV